MLLADPELPDGFEVGHHTDREGWTGCTVILAPPQTVAAGEVRGGGPGTRESDLLSPASNAPGVQAVLFTGGSAFGLAAADGVVAHLEQRGLGYATPAAVVPLVSAAVVYDLLLGSSHARPGPQDGLAACAAAARHFERGSVGAGTGCTVGKLLGAEAWTKGGLGYAAARAGDALVGALAVVNAVGDVLAEDGSVLAGVRDPAGGYRRTVELLASGSFPPRVSARESTTLVCVVSDAALSKTQAWIVARAASAGVARAVEPSATAFDGDVAYVLASGTVPAEPLAVGAVAAQVSAAAIRDAVRQAAAAPGAPAVRDP